MATVPIFAPDGTLGDVPYNRMKDALAAGGKPGVTIKSPDGKLGVIPADRTQDAVKAGASIVPIKEQETQHPGFWANIADDMKGMLHPAGFSPYPGMDQDAKTATAAQAGQQDQARATAGYSGAYRALAPVAQAVGVNVPGMEQSAQQGDTAGVLGHAAAPLAAMATAEAARQAPGLASRTALLGRTPQEAYQSALKPSTTIPPARVARMVNTGLAEGIPVSPAGVEKLRSLIDDVNDKIAATIQSNPNHPIDTAAVAQRAEDAKAGFANQVNPTADLQAIEDSKTEFQRNNPIAMTAENAQSMKQGTYQQIGAKAYGEMKTASVEAQKSLARGLKEELANAFPELNDLNAQDSKLYDLQPVLQKAIQREANHQLGGIGTPITAGAAKAVTGSNTAAAIAGVMKAIVDNPNVKSRLAIALSKSGATLPAANAKIAAYSAALASAASNNADANQADQSPSQ